MVSCGYVILSRTATCSPFTKHSVSACLHLAPASVCLQATLTTAAMAPALTTRWMWPRSHVSAHPHCACKLPAAPARVWSLQLSAWSWLLRRHRTRSCARAWTACCAIHWRLCCFEWRLRQGWAGRRQTGRLVLCRPSAAGMHTRCKACAWASVQQCLCWGPVLFMIDSLMCQELCPGSGCPWQLCPGLARSSVHITLSGRRPLAGQAGLAAHAPHRLRNPSSALHGRATFLPPPKNLRPR